MADKIAKRGISVYIDGQQVTNSVRSIKAEMRKLANEQANMTVGSDEYIRHTRKIAQLDGILQGHKDYQVEIAKQYSKMGDAAQDFEKKSGGLWSKIKSGFSDAKGAIIAFLASITVDRAIDDFAALEDKYADVMKTTGMTRDEVVKLNDEFKKIDTRTFRDGLNDMAEEAGRIGIAKDEVLDFVKAMDISNVALGDSFEGGASEIANTLGKLKFLFKETQDMGVEKAYLSIGSAINELGANGVASETNIANFTTRMGSLPEALKPSISSTLALGAAFEESGIEAEIASRGYGIFISRASTKSGEFAKVMGITKKEVEDLINTNPLEFFLKFSEGMKGMSATEVSKTLNSLKVNADGVNKIIGAAASNTDRFRELIDLSNKSFADGTSVINEFNIKNETFAADLDKSKKVLQDYIYELGERLAPYMKEGIQLGGSAIKVLGVLTGFLFNNAKVILTVVAAIGAYNTGLALTELWNKRVLVAEKANLILSELQKRAFLAKLIIIDLYNGRMSLATARTEMFNLVLKMNSLGAFLAVITALLGALYIYSSKVKEITLLHKSQENINKKVNDELSTQKSRIDILVSTLNNEKVALELRKKALSDLKEIMPGYNAELTNEGKLINNNTEAIRKYLVQLERQIKMKAAEDELAELYKSEREQQKEVSRIENIIKEREKAVKDYTSSTSAFDLRPSSGAATMSNEINRFNESLDKNKKELTKTKDVIDTIKTEIQSIIESSPVLVTNDENTGGGGSDETKADKASIQRQKLQDELKKLEDAHLRAMSILKENYLKDDLKTEYEHNQELLQEQNKYDKDRKAKLELLKKELTDPSIRIDIAKQIADIDNKNFDRQIQQANKIKKILLDADPIEQEKQAYESRLRELGLFNDDVTKRTESQQKAAELLETQHKDNLRKLSRKEANLQLKQLETEQAETERLLTERKVKEKMSEQQFNDEKLKIEADFLKRKLQINGLSKEKAEELQKQLAYNETDLLTNRAEGRQAIIDQYGLQKAKDLKETELAILKYYEEQNLLTHEEALKVRALIDQKYLDSFVSKFTQVNEIVSQMGGNLSGTMANFQSAEESAVSRKYDKQIAAAEGNSKKQKKLEEKKQKDLNAIRARYADKQFLVTVAQTISSTALAAMESYKAMAGIPVVGPALGAAAAAAAIAYGASQISVAKEQRDAAKEGYFDGGYTGGTDPREVRGYFPDGSPYHGKEFVANHKSTSNNLLRPLFDVVDDAQRHNTVGSLTKKDLAKALHITSPGYFDGGYTGAMPNESFRRDIRYDDSYDRFINVMERLEARLEKPLNSSVKITGDDGFENQWNLYNKMKNNASR